MINPQLRSLPNNLKVLLSEIPYSGSLTVLILVAAGSRYETKQINGLAHFAEHMFFKGTQKRPTAFEISSLIDGIGGEFNAFTSKEFTGYYVKASAKHLELIEDVLSDMLLNSKFDDQEIERERGVIIEELRMYLDTPTRHIGDVFEELLFGDQPLGWDTVGTVDSIRSIQRADFIRFKEKFYHPSSMLISIAGGIKEEDVLKLSKNYFGSIKDKEPEKFLPLQEKKNGPAVKIFYKDTQQAHLMVGVPAYPRGHEKRYKLGVMNALLGASMSSRLFIQVRERRGLAYYVRSSVEEYADTGYFAAQAGVETSKIKDSLKVILGEFAKLVAQAVEEAEIKKAKEFIKGKLILELEDSREVSTLFGLQQLLEGRVRTIEEINNEIDKVTPYDIKEVAYDIFNNNLNLAIIGPYRDESEFLNLLKF